MCIWFAMPTVALLCCDSKSQSSTHRARTPRVVPWHLRQQWVSCKAAMLMDNHETSIKHSVLESHWKNCWASLGHGNSNRNMERSWNLSADVQLNLVSEVQGGTPDPWHICTLNTLHIIVLVTKQELVGICFLYVQPTKILYVCFNS